MGTIVLTRPENAKSAVKLGFPVVMEKREVPHNSRVIRWGNGLETDSSGWSLVLNKHSVLQISTDKLTALRSMGRVVTVPNSYDCGETLPRGHRYVGRPASHSEGSDFHLIDCRTQAATLTDDHATRYIEDANEYRVWFVREKYLVARRVPISAKGQSASDSCRSKWGYEFIPACFPKLKEEVTKARSAIPLDFGAIDVLWKEGEGNQPGKWYFLEFNSAPSLDHDKVLKHFQTHLKAILGPEAASEVAEQVQTPQSVARRPQTIPTRNYATPSVQAPSSDWKAKYKAKLIAEKKAEEERIYKEVYGELGE